MTSIIRRTLWKVRFFIPNRLFCQITTNIFCSFSYMLHLRKIYLIIKAGFRKYLLTLRKLSQSFQLFNKFNENFSKISANTEFKQKSVHSCVCVKKININSFYCLNQMQVFFNYATEGRDQGTLKLMVVTQAVQGTSQLIVTSVRLFCKQSNNTLYCETSEKQWLVQQLMFKVV